jgi:hypothetical protein
MKAYGGVDVYIHVFLPSVLVGCEWSASRPGRSNPFAHWIESWVAPSDGLNDVEKRKFLTLRTAKHFRRIRFIIVPNCLSNSMEAESFLRNQPSLSYWRIFQYFVE